MKKLLPEQWKFNPPDNIQIVDVRSIHELEPHADAWADLLLQSTAASPMLSYPLISAFFETQILPSETWLCLFAYKGKKLLGVLPLLVVKSFSLFGLSLLFLKTPYNNFHTSAVDCLTLRGRENILELFVDYLSCMPKTWQLIRFREMPEHSPSMLYMNRHEKRLKIVKKLSGGENYIQLPADYEQYHARLSSGFKRQLKRRTGKLDKLTDVRFLCREDKRSSVENMKRFEDAEDHGWKGGKKSSIKAVVANSRFLAIAAERFQNYGWMKWNFLEIEEKTIAAQYCIQINRTLYLIKIGYDEEYSFCTPGNLLFNKVIQNACENRNVDEINCVATCAWHKNWGMTKRLLYDLIILPQIPIMSALLAQVLNSKIVQKYLWGIKTP